MKKTLYPILSGIIIPMFVFTCSSFATQNETQVKTENYAIEERANNNQSTNNHQSTNDSQQQNTAANIQNTMNNSSIGNIDKMINVEDPFNVTVDTSVATVDNINLWVNLKASQIVRVIQTVGKWITFIVFIICAIKTVVGIFGKSENISKGVTAMIISAICFVAIEYADIIFQFLLKFIVH